MTKSMSEWEAIKREDMELETQIIEPPPRDGRSER